MPLLFRPRTLVFRQSLGDVTKPGMKLRAQIRPHGSPSYLAQLRSGGDPETKEAARAIMFRCLGTFSAGKCGLLFALLNATPISSCISSADCSIFELTQPFVLPFSAFSGDVVLLDPSGATSDVFRIFNDFVNTGGGTGLGRQTFLFSVDEGNLPSPSTLSANAVFPRRTRPSSTDSPRPITLGTELLSPFQRRNAADASSHLLSG